MITNMDGRQKNTKRAKERVVGEKIFWRGRVGVSQVLFAESWLNYVGVWVTLVGTIFNITHAIFFGPTQPRNHVI